MSASKILAMLVTALVVLATGCSSPESDSLPSTTGGSRLPAGIATVSDPTGDIRDAGGQSLPQGALSADIKAAAVSLSADQLMLSLEQASPVPAGVTDVKAALPGWLTYTLFIADEEDDLLCMARLQLLGAEWHADVYDAGTELSVALEGGPTLSGATLAHAFPRTLLPALSSPFKWAVGAEWSVPSAAEACGFIAYGDLAPGDGTQGYDGYPAEWAVYAD